MEIDYQMIINEFGQIIAVVTPIALAFRPSTMDIPLCTKCYLWRIHKQIKLKGEKMKYRFTAIKYKPKGSKNWYKFTFKKGNTKYSLKHLKGDRYV